MGVGSSTLYRHPHVLGAGLSWDLWQLYSTSAAGKPSCLSPTWKFRLPQQAASCHQFFASTRSRSKPLVIIVWIKKAFLENNSFLFFIFISRLFKINCSSSLETHSFIFPQWIEKVLKIFFTEGLKWFRVFQKWKKTFTKNVHPLKNFLSQADTKMFCLQL